MSSSSVSSSSLPNRWVLAIAAFSMQLALGSVYAWSVFLNPVIAFRVLRDCRPLRLPPLSLFSSAAGGKKSF